MQSIQAKRVDLWDGGERHYFGYYINPLIGNDAIKSASPQCQVTLVELTVFDNLSELHENSLRKLRISAWSKLSREERAALNMVEQPA